MGNRSIRPPLVSDAHRLSPLAPSPWRRPSTALLAGGPRHVRRGRGPSPDYGPLQPAIDRNDGASPAAPARRTSSYLSFGWTGDMMSDGIATPCVPRRHGGICRRSRPGAPHSQS